MKIQTEIKNIIKPRKINKKSHIRVIALSRSLGLLSDDIKEEAIKRLKNYGFTLSFGKHVDEMDEFQSSSVAFRISDLHDAFSDNKVDVILTVIGGYNSNQLLNKIDYELIKNNPKILCGFSDITAVSNAITSKTGLITYNGPHFSSWAMKHGFEYSIEYFKKCCMSDNAYDLIPPKSWSDDAWYLDQEARDYIDNDGYWILQEGCALGRGIGGHVRCLNALQGTQFWPTLDDAVLILEEDDEINPQLFDRQLQSLIQQPDFKLVKGILIGRFQKKSNMTKKLLNKIINSKDELRGLPIIANVDFGHTTPLATIPIGGIIKISSDNKRVTIRIIEH